MKESWTYKKLGDYIEEFSERDKGKGYPVYSVTNSKGFCQEFFGKNVASENTSNYKIVPRGCFAYNPSRINVGSVAWQNEEDNVSVSPLYVVFSVSPELRQDYLLYYFRSSYSMTYINALARGAVRNNLRLSVLKKFDIPFRTLTEQQQIVSELDLLSGIIEKQKAQIKELDNLAQSIFYNMFGDPTKNEKGWEIKQMIDVYKFIDYRGKTPNKTNHGIPLITAKNIRKGEIDYTIEEYISEEEYSQRQTRGIAQKGDILFTTEAPMGFAAIADKEIFSTGQRLITFQAKDNQVINNIFALYYILSENFQRELNRQATGSTVKGIKGSRLEKFPIQIPPLSLQKDFAEKMAIIERMKTKIRRNLKESEKLFNSRMEYYFN